MRLAVWATAGIWALFLITAVSLYLWHRHEVRTEREQWTADPVEYGPPDPLGF